MPLLLSPIGFTRMMHTAGDVAGVTAAGVAKTIFTLSSMSGHSMEEVRAAATGPVWFQLYFLGGRMGAEQLVDRARKCDFAAVVVTMDTQIPGDRLARASTGSLRRSASIVARQPKWPASLRRDLSGYWIRLWMDSNSTSFTRTHRRPTDR